MFFAADAGEVSLSVTYITAAAAILSALITALVTLIVASSGRKAEADRARAREAELKAETLRAQERENEAAKKAFEKQAEARAAEERFREMQRIAREYQLEAKASEDRHREMQTNLREQLAAANGVATVLRGIQAQLTSQVAILNERLVQRGGEAPEIVAELGLDPGEPPKDDATVAGATEVKPIPGKRGSYVLWVDSPLAKSPRFVHFSWENDSYRIRDYVGGRLLHGGSIPRPEEGFQLEPCPMDRDAVWAAATIRVPAHAELFHPVGDFVWWQARLAQMTRGRELLEAGGQADWSKDRIIGTLAQFQRRATYGAIAGVAGGIPFGLMNGRTKSPLNSWVVAANTDRGINTRRGWPTGYVDGEIAPECLEQIHERKEDFIADPNSLMGWLDAMAQTAATQDGAPNAEILPANLEEGLPLILRTQDRIGVGAFAEVFRHPQNGRVYKLFKQSDTGNLLNDNSEHEPGMRRLVFQAEREAYVIAMRSDAIRPFIPTYYGTCEVDQVIDDDGSDISDQFMLECCYIVDFVEGDDTKLTNNLVQQHEHLRQLTAAMVENGITYWNDGAVFHPADPARTKIIDFAVNDAYGEAERALIQGG